MRIERAQVIPFSTTVVGGIRNARRSWHARRGVLLRLVDEQGRTGLGEAAPLPEYSADTMEACSVALEQLHWTDADDLDLTRPVAPQLAAWSSVIDEGLPAARFALETALLDLAAQRAQAPAWALLRSPSGGAVDPVPLSSLVTEVEEIRAVQGAMAAIERGMTTFKVKVGTPSRLDRELSLLRTLRRALGPRVAIRLDANGSLPAATLEARLAAFSECDPEFIEEPAPLAAVEALQRCPMPVALDESLQNAENTEALTRVAERSWCVAVVLKPAALGGLSRCLELAEWAAHSTLHVTVSHLFDGVVGHTAAAHLALAVASRSVASGLDVHAALDAWPAPEGDLIGENSVLPTSRPGLGLDAERILAGKP